MPHLLRKVISSLVSPSSLFLLLPAAIAVAAAAAVVLILPLPFAGSSAGQHIPTRKHGSTKGERNGNSLNILMD